MKRRAIKTALSAVKVADCLICIDGLPAAVTAFAWATEMARKLKQSITVRTPAGEPIGTIDKAFLTGTKAELAEARRAAKTANAVEPKAPKEKATAPTGKRLEVVQLAMRPEGASVKELIALKSSCPIPVSA
jgi:hypothetical protein